MTSIDRNGITIGVLEYPFSGDVRVGPEPFELVLERFESRKLSEL